MEGKRLYPVHYGCPIATLLAEDPAMVWMSSSKRFSCFGCILQTEDILIAFRYPNCYISTERGDQLESIEKKKNMNFSPVAIVLSLAVAVFMLAVLYWLFYPTHKTVEIHGEGTYTGQLRGSTFHGYGTYESLNGSVYEGYFKRGYFDGFGTLTFINDSKYIGEFKEGYFHGKGLLMTSDGQVVEGTWSMGRMVE